MQNEIDETELSRFQNRMKKKYKQQDQDDKMVGSCDNCGAEHPRNMKEAEEETKEWPHNLVYPNHKPHFCKKCNRWADYLGQHAATCRLAADRAYKETKKNVKEEELGEANLKDKLLHKRQQVDSLEREIISARDAGRSTKSLQADLAKLQSGIRNLSMKAKHYGLGEAEENKQFQKSKAKPKITEERLLSDILAEAKTFDPAVMQPGDDAAFEFGTAPARIKRDETLPLTTEHKDKWAGMPKCRRCNKPSNYTPAGGLCMRCQQATPAKPVKESRSVEPKVVGHFIQTHLPSGKKHRGAMMDTHLGELGNNGRLSTGEKVTKDHILKHWNASQPKTYKYEWDKDVKETEIKGNDKAQKCPECGKSHAPSVPCAAKKVLMEPQKLDTKGQNPNGRFQAAGAVARTDALESEGRKGPVSAENRLESLVASRNGTLTEKPEGTTFNRMWNTPEEAEAHRKMLAKNGHKAWVNPSPDGKHIVYYQSEEEHLNEAELIEVKKRGKKWNKLAHVRSIARNVVGQVKKTTVIMPKKQKPPKHKKQVYNFDEEVDALFEEMIGEATTTETAHARAARLHDAAAAHAKSPDAVIDRPYKDACSASFATKDKGIERHIQSNANHYNYDYIPHFGGRAAFHTKLAQMHRDADKVNEAVKKKCAAAHLWPKALSPTARRCL